MQQRHNGIKRLLLFLIVPVLGLSLFSNLLFANSNANAVNSVSLTTEQQTASITYYNVLRKCIYSYMRGDISTVGIDDNSNADPLKVSWFDVNSGVTNFIVYAKPSGQSCEQIASEAMQLWGFKSDGSDFLTQMGYKLQATGSQASAPRYHGSPDGRTRLTKFESLIQAIQGAFPTQQNFSGDAGLSGATKYYAYKSVLDKCSVKQVGDGPFSSLNQSQLDLINNNRTVDHTVYTTVTLANGDGTTTKFGYSYADNISSPLVVYGHISESLPGSVGGGGMLTSSCKDALSALTNSAQAASTDGAATICAKTYTDINQIKACANGMSNTSNISYCSTAYKDIAANQIGPAVDNTTVRDACYAGQGQNGGNYCYIKGGYTSTLVFTACVSGRANSADPAYCTTTYPGQYSAGKYSDQADQVTACKFGQRLGPASGLTVPPTPDCNLNPNGVGCKPAADATTCINIYGLGWFICPIMGAIGGLNDAMYKWVSDVLILNPLTQYDSSGTVTPLYQNWSVIRNIANVLLVIGFLIIIFSQISSVGISNYGVKKMLPRIILVAIAINLSWVLMSLAVDVVNVVGVGLNTLLSSLAVSTPITFAAVTDALLGGATTVTVGVGVAIPIVIITGSTAAVMVLLALPFLLGATLALLAAVATLFVRNALVILLAIIAPVAIAAAILPNTEEYFKKWRKLLTSMLLLFPLAALLFAGAKFAAFVILNSNIPGGVIAALFILAAPLGMLPWLARSSGGIMATVGNKLGGFAKVGQNALQKGLAQSVATRRAEYKSSDKGFWGNRVKARPYKDKNGNYVRDKAGNLKTRKRTAAGGYNSHVEGLKTRQATAEKKAGTNFKNVGLREDGSRRAARISGIVDASKTAGLEEKAVDAQYGARLESRQLTPGSIESRLTKNLDDAEATSKGYQGRLKYEQAERIRTGQANTVAGSIASDDPTILNLRDVSKQAYVAEAGAASEEEQNKRLNIESREADHFVQIEHEAKEGIKVQETRQEADFKQHQNERAAQNVLDRENDPSVELDATLQQNAQDRRIETDEAEIKSRQETVAHNDEGLEELEKRKQRAEFEVENVHNASKGEFEASKLPDGENSDLFAESLLGKASSDKTAAEQRRIENEARLGVNQTRADGSQLFTQEYEKNPDGSVKRDGNDNPILAEGSDTNALGTIRDLDQDTQASTQAGTYAEGGKGIIYAQKVNKGFLEGDERGLELAAAASGADANVKNVDGTAKYEEIKDINGDPVYEKEADGVTDKMVNGQKVPATRKAASVLTEAKAAKASLEDSENDQNTIVSLAKSRSMPGVAALKRLGVSTTGEQLLDASGHPEVGAKGAEALGYIRYAAGRSDRQTTMALLSHVGQMGAEAKSARDEIERIEKEGGSPTKEARDEAKRLTDGAREAQRVLLEAGDSSLPPWMGGSDRQKLAEGTFVETTEQNAISSIVSAKLTADSFAGMDIRNRDTFVKSLEQISTPTPQQITELAPSIPGYESMTDEQKNEAVGNIVIEKNLRKIAAAEIPDYDSMTDEQKNEAVDAALPVMRQNFAQVIIPIDKAQFDVRLNRNLAPRDRERYDTMRKLIKQVAGPDVKPKQMKPDGSEEDYTGYTPST